MQSFNFSCPLAETAERYAMNRLPPPAAHAFEQHLSGCAHCANTIDFADEFVSLLAEVEPV